MHRDSLVPRPPLQLLSLAVRKAEAIFFLHGAKKSCGVETGNEASFHVDRGSENQPRSSLKGKFAVHTPHIHDPIQHSKPFHVTTTFMWKYRHIRQV